MKDGLVEYTYTRLNSVYYVLHDIIIIIILIKLTIKYK